MNLTQQLKAWIRETGKLSAASVLFVLTAICDASVGQTSEDTWRLAGTFNNWNVRSDAWRMSRLPDGKYYLRRDFPAGTHRFKFVKNGDWNSGHLGAAEEEGHLAQPGKDLHLDVARTGSVPITLDPLRRTWVRDVPIVTLPVAVARVSGLPRRAVPMRIDLTDSLFPPGLTFGEARVEPVDAGSALAIADQAETHQPGFVTVIPQRAGRIDLRVAVRAGEEDLWSDEIQLSLDVFSRVSMMLTSDIAATPGGVGDLVPVDQLTWASVLRSPETSEQRVEVVDENLGRRSSRTFYPVVAGETFAIEYDLPTGAVRATPGKFRVIERDGEYRLKEEWPQIPAGTVWHDPRRHDHVHSISAGLGLADLAAWSVEGSVAGVDVLLGKQDPVTVPMRLTERSDGFERWTARIESGGSRLVYGLRVSKPDGDALLQGMHDVEIRPDFETPDWAKSAVWYQIFPERFRNGNAANDPVGDDVFAVKWNAPWHDVLLGEFEAWTARVRSFGEDPNRFDRQQTGEPGGRFYNVVWDRRYGGDLQGVIEKLDSIREMGVNAIYLNPVFEGSSSHKYDTSDFRHVDDNFGNHSAVPARWAPDPTESLEDPETWKWTEADRTLLTLIDMAHRRDMRVILDGVFNHVGRQHPAFVDLMEKGRASNYVEWFYPEFDEVGELIAWRAWDRPSGWLPKLRQNPDGSLAAPVRDHIFAITQRWMDPNGDGNPADGIDGWRLDVALDIGAPFWREWSTFVKFINPDAYIVAEIWKDDEAMPHLRGDQFDAQMHYPFAMAVTDWLVMTPGMTADDLGSALKSVFGNDLPQTQLVQQNLLESHDTDRYVSNLFNAHAGRVFDTGNRPQQGEAYREGRPDDRSYALARLAMILQMTYPGAPMVYYGSEVGMYGADDPSCRKPRPWPDLQQMQEPGEQARWDLQEEFAGWMRLRRDDRTLQLGDVMHVSTGSADVFAFIRQCNEERRLVIVNKGGMSYPVSRLIPEWNGLPAAVGAMDGVLIDLPDLADVVDDSQ